MIDVIDHIDSTGNNSVQITWLDADKEYRETEKEERISRPPASAGSRPGNPKMGKNAIGEKIV